MRVRAAVGDWRRVVLRFALAWMVPGTPLIAAAQEPGARAHVASLVETSSDASVGATAAAPDAASRGLDKTCDVCPS
ncbi:MAG TPA: hypothetical protein VGG73_08935, partial [Vicinamibacterales bacterium]